MKRLAVSTLVLVLAGVGVLAYWRVSLAQDTRPANADLVEKLRKDLEKTQLDLAALGEKHEALRDEFYKLKVAFSQHTHPVRFWDEKARQSTDWKFPGSFFIAYPKVGAGKTDADAVQAGGTWGTP